MTVTGTCGVGITCNLEDPSIGLRGASVTCQVQVAVTSSTSTGSDRVGLHVIQHTNMTVSAGYDGAVIDARLTSTGASWTDHDHGCKVTNCCAEPIATTPG